ncbi:putative non-specific serine/threonine protein kinase [Helianthus annuus]|uniref:Non-specific serine/threonine protein kinase n=1 Tax=Helianthus annuus TaxID=4232 RepID=A0A251UAQ4_HELAN|nr:putative non-specific serine/threonine protein kinase [Helianthus annuus]KAJ0549186.1 putative non-specific serine/threonine protein kinase [Helianthus annuus]KAJ0562138.1 putative non-specific serine/threonine protein kinase [Helianthus annuus]KAJ0727512.1 putative non-specific serine/threonine protein kinase [Helianthus annuus]KAJ0730309.1 putative non-specific serine/threonine protein kinase [Helianthus annuus]
MNRIIGEIPPSLGNLKALKLLSISHNKISGHIPVSFGNLVNIESFDSHNEISGSIPQSLVKLSQLTVLDVSNNMLTGKIPVGGQVDTVNGFQNNIGLCGMQISVTCPEDIWPLKGRAEEEEKQSWILWEGPWIGFPVGFFSSIIIMGSFWIFFCSLKFGEN